MRYWILLLCCLFLLSCNREHCACGPLAISVNVGDSTLELVDSIIIHYYEIGSNFSIPIKDRLMSQASHGEDSLSVSGDYRGYGAYLGRIIGTGYDYIFEFKKRGKSHKISKVMEVQEFVNCDKLREYGSCMNHPWSYELDGVLKQGDYTINFNK